MLGVNPLSIVFPGNCDLLLWKLRKPKRQPKYTTETQNGIIKRFLMEGTPKDHLVPTPHHKQRHLLLGQTAKSPNPAWPWRTRTSGRTRKQSDFKKNTGKQTCLTSEG